MIHFAYEWYIAALMLFTGLYCMLASRGIARQLIGLEIVLKAALLAVVSAGALSNNLGLAQALLAVLIVIEAVVAAAGLSLLVKAWRANGTADLWELDGLKDH